MSVAETLSIQLKARVGALDLDIELETGVGPTAIVGPNGSGKTTLLSLILGVLPSAEGTLRIGNSVIFDSARRINLPLERRQIGYVPQDYALFPNRTVRGNVEFAISSATSRIEQPERMRRAEALLAEFGLSEHLEQRILTLSGGEKQRVALVRALSVSPRTLLLDEPLSALDVHSRREVREFLSGYLGRLQIPTLVVTHDAADAQLLGHRVAVLERGRITQVGRWDELTARPASQFVEEFVATSSMTKATRVALDR